MIHESVGETVGDTPIVRLSDSPQLLGKVEAMNPGGSMKDRIGFGMVEQAEERGELEGIDTICEATSGNTGIGVALACIEYDYNCVLMISKGKSEAKKKMMKALGANVVECPSVPHDHPESYQSVAKSYEENYEGVYLLNQYDNYDNPESHYRTTGEEILRQTGGRITHFVCAMGSGGTISGVGKRLKEFSPEIEVIGVDTTQSNITDLFEGKEDYEPKSDRIEGIGRTYKPDATWFEYVDEVVETDEEGAFTHARKLSEEHGLFVGGSAGGVYDVMKSYDFDDSDMVVGLFADSGDRYLDTIYDDEWMQSEGYL